MKAIYNFVTFLAAVVVLGWAGWSVYSHWDILVKKAATVAPAVVPTKPDKHHCGCCKSCNCGNANCKGGSEKKCCEACGCTDADCCKK